MSERHSPPFSMPSDAIIPTLLVVAISGFSYLTLTGTLESRRPKIADDSQQPPVPVGAEGFESGFSRLWQDPFSGDYARVNQLSANPPPPCPELKIVCPVAIQIARRVKELQEKNRKVLCMPVMVPGSPYVESREQRRRTRYASLSALGDAGFSLLHPERMSYITLPVCVQTGPRPSRKSINLVVPIKIHYRSQVDPSSTRNAQDANLKPKYAAVVVLWINENQLGVEPLSTISQVIEHVFANVQPNNSGGDGTNDPAVDIAIIGPSSSDVLLAMAREDEKWPMSKTAASARSDLPKPAATPQYFSSGRFGEATLYSPRATIDRKALSKGGRDNQQQLKNFMQHPNPRSGLNVVRTSGDDRSLAHLLKEELRLRGAWPQPNPSLPLADKQHVVLITERDTLYGQAFRRTFETLLKAECVPTRLHHFTYLRGIDGQYPRSDTLEDLPARSTDPSKGDAAPQNTFKELPHGAGQFDYIRRLVRRIGDLRQQLQINGKGDIKAIGVVGTDLFDKLLVLRALRPHFPAAKFFTTDLDARFAHYDELPYTRNLLVASHFALELNGGTFGPTAPPFRDSYQTATYFSVRLAVDHEQRDWKSRLKESLPSGDPLDPWGLRDGPAYLQPLMFEIGRGGPYQLTRSAVPNRPSIHPCSPRELAHWPSWWWLWRIVTMVMVLLVAAIAALITKISAPTQDSAPTSNSIPNTEPVSITDPVTTKDKERGREAAFLRGCLFALLVFLILWLGLTYAYLLFTSTPVTTGKFTQMATVMSATILVYVTVLTMMHFAPLTAPSRVALAGNEPSHNRTTKTTSVSIQAATALSALLLLVLITRDHQNADGQPLTFSTGISVWPPTLIRLSALILAVVFAEKAIRKLDKNEVELERDYHITRTGKEPVQPSNTVADWRHGFLQHLRRLEANLKGTFANWRQGPLWTHGADGADPVTLCQQYFKYERGGARLVRVAIWTATLFAFLLVIFQATEYPAISYRGSLSFWTATTVLYAASFAVMFMILFTLDALLVCQRLADHLGRKPQRWNTTIEESEYYREAKVRLWNQPTAGKTTEGKPTEDRLNPQADALSELVTIRFIADRTRVVGRLIYLPFILLTVMLLARHHLIDTSYLPPAVIVVLAGFFLALLAAGTYLRRSAARMKQRALDRLQQQLSRTYRSGEGSGVKEQVEIIIEDVIAERRGAFRPISDDPLLGALAVPSVIVTAMLVAERYMMQ